MLDRMQPFFQLAAFLLTSVTGMAQPPTSQPAGPEDAQMVRVTAAALADEVQAGNPVDFDVVVQNVADRDITIMIATGDEDFLVDATGPSGRHVAATAYSRLVAVNRAAVVGRRPEHLGPGERLTYRLRVSRFCDMSVTGTYTVSATFLLGLPRQLEEQKHISNPVMVRIVSPEGNHGPRRPTTNPSTGQAAGG